MSFTLFAFTFGISAFGYARHAAHLRGGVVPLYRPFPGGMAYAKDWRLQLKDWRWNLKVIVMWVPAFGVYIWGAVVQMPILALLSGFAAVWLGRSMRKDLQLIYGGPLPWVVNPRYVPGFVIKAITKWPMLPFDFWSVGMSVTFFVLLNSWISVQWGNGTWNFICG